MAVTVQPESWAQRHLFGVPSERQHVVRFIVLRNGRISSELEEPEFYTAVSLVGCWRSSSGPSVVSHSKHNGWRAVTPIETETASRARSATSCYAMRLQIELLGMCNIRCRSALIGCNLGLTRAKGTVSASKRSVAATEGRCYMASAVQETQTWSTCVIGFVDQFEMIESLERQCCSS